MLLTFGTCTSLDPLLPLLQCHEYIACHTYISRNQRYCSSMVRHGAQRRRQLRRLCRRAPPSKQIHRRHLCDRFCWYLGLLTLLSWWHLLLPGTSHTMP